MHVRFQRWVKGIGSPIARIRTHLDNRKRDKLLVNCQISDAVALKRLSTEILQLKQQKSALNDDVKRIKSAGDKARRELSQILLEKNRAATAAAAKNNASATDQQEGGSAPLAPDAAFITFEALSFVCVGLIVAALAALHMMQEARARATKLTQRLKSATPAVVVEKEVAVYQKRVAELEAQGQLDRDKAVAVQRQLEQAESEVESHQYRIAELERERSGGATTAEQEEEVKSWRERVAVAQATADAQARACTKLQQEKDTALAELAQASVALDKAEGPAAQAQVQLVKAGRDQVALALALEETRDALAAAMLRVEEAEERGRQNTDVVTAERDELRSQLRISMERTDQCFLEIEAQLVLEKRKVKDHVASIRNLEQKLTETERRKGLSPHRPSVLGIGNAVDVDVGGPADGAEDVAALTKRDSPASLPNGAGGDMNKSQVQVGALTKQRDLLVASKNILEDRISELNSEVKWVDQDREKLQARVADLEATLAAHTTQLASSTALASRNAVLEAAALDAAAQLALLRQRLADAVAARDAKDLDLQRDRLFLKEVRVRVPSHALPLPGPLNPAHLAGLALFSV